MAVDLRRLHNLAEAARERAQASQQQRRTGQSWYRIENKPTGEAEIFVYEMIGEWGVSAQDFVNDLRALKAAAISLHVNSEGGEVFDGLAIYEAIAAHPAQFTGYVDGLAASAASFIVMACNRVVMAKRARMMIHDAHGFTMGNARDMRSMADLLDDLSDNIADIYADKAGGTRAQWRTAMQAASGGPDGSWYSADQAVKAGLADEVRGEDEGETAAAAAGARAEAPPVDRSLIENVRQPVEAVWSSEEFLAAVRSVEAPPPPPIPDGRALRALFDLA